MHTTRKPRWLDAALGCLTGALSAAAFALSFEALHELATRAGVTDPLAALLPLIIDGTAVVATLAVLSDTLLGRASRWPWAVVASASLVSLTGNLLHAQPLAIAWFVAALPPVALMTSLEMLMRQLRTRMTPPPDPAGPATSATAISTRTPYTSKGRPTRRVASLPTRRNPRPDVVAYLAEAEALGHEVTGPSLARHLGCSDSYARRLLRDHRAASRPLELAA